MSDPNADRQREFLHSWSKSMLGRRPSIGLPTRGLRGLAVIAGSVALVVGVVAGGVAVVMTVGGRDTATLTSADLTTQAQAPAPSPSTTVAAALQPSPTGSPKAKKSEKKAKAPKKKATAPKKKAKAKATTTRTVGLIRNLVTGMCVDLPNYDGAGENVLVTQYYCRSGSADNQMYQTITKADGTFLLRNVKSQWCLDVNGSGMAEKGIVVNTHTCLLGNQDNQMFRKKAHGKGFYLVNVKSGLCLDVSNADGDTRNRPDEKLTLWTCSPDDDHIWTFG